MLKKTYIFDIDGVLLEQPKDSSNTYSYCSKELENISGMPTLLQYIEEKGHRILLVTGRASIFREETINTLKKAGYVWHELIMDCGRGPRYIINDIDESGNHRAFAINVERNIPACSFDDFKDIYGVC